MACSEHLWEYTVLHVCHTVNVPYPALHSYIRYCLWCDIREKLVNGEWVEYAPA